MLRCNSDDVVLSLATAPIDARTGNRVLYSVNWLATNDSMIGEVNPDWVRRELAWFNSGSNKLEDMEGPVPKLFQACAGWDGKVNSAYGHILFNSHTSHSLYSKVLNTFLGEGASTRHAVAIISDRDVHSLAKLHGRNDFICTNALNFMIDDDNRLHIIAQMRSMDAVFGYRADYSMWDDVMKGILIDLNNAGTIGTVYRGGITFQVANLHVYPRHFDLLAEEADKVHDRLDRESRRQWMEPDQREALRNRHDALDVAGTQQPHHNEPVGTGEAAS